MQANKNQETHSAMLTSTLAIAAMSTILKKGQANLAIKTGKLIVKWMTSTLQLIRISMTFSPTFLSFYFSKIVQIATDLLMKLSGQLLNQLTDLKGTN